MPNHQAIEQMIGYLYQVRYALALLLDNDNEELQISIEKFDDIAFSSDDEPKQLIQLKHHIRHQGSLSDASTDLWRTLKVWIDAIEGKSEMVRNTKFLIITTSIAPVKSAAYHLKANNEIRDVQKAYDLLCGVCQTSENKEHLKYYSAFTMADTTIIKELINNIIVIDYANDIIEIEKVYRRIIRYSCLPKYEDQICERLEGWWYRKSVEALCADQPTFVSQSQIRSFIVSISQEYADDNLPIDMWDIATEISEDSLSPDERLFYEQLKLICVGNGRIRTALRDYYRAFKQRANWVRNDLLYLNELGTYERNLIDEWEHCFAEMQDELSDYGNRPEDHVKVKYGRALLSKIEGRDIRIRPK